MADQSKGQGTAEPNSMKKGCRSGDLSMNDKRGTTARNRLQFKAFSVGQKRISTQIHVWAKRGQAHRLICQTITTMGVDQPKNSSATSGILRASSNTNTLHTTSSSKMQRDQSRPKTEVNGKSGPVGQTNQQYLEHNSQRPFLHQQHLRPSSLTMSCTETNFTDTTSTNPTATLKKKADRSREENMNNKPQPEEVQDCQDTVCLVTA